GVMGGRGAPGDGGAPLHGAATVYISQPASVDGEIRARLPGELDLHVGMRWVVLSRFQAFDVRGYGSTFPNAGIPEWNERPRGFHDPVAVWAGVEQLDLRERDLIRLGGRIGFETSAVDDARTS